MRSLFAGTVLLAGLLVANLAMAAGWSGLYAGLNAGVGINDSRYTLRPTGCFVTSLLCGGPLSNNPLRTDSANFNDTVFIGGGQIGANFQISKLVLGVETDFDYNGVNESDSVNRPLASPLVGNFVHKVTQRVDFLGTLRGRIGFTPVDPVLLYATAGLAYGHIHSSSNLLFTAAGDTYGGSSSTTRTGWTVGAGSEYAFTPNWSAKFEYLFIDLGSHSYSDPGTNALSQRLGSSYATDLKTREHVIRIGFNYKFLGF